MVSSLAPDSHSSRSCLRVIFRNWSLWSVGSRKPGRRIVRRPLNNPDTYYSVSEIYLETLQHRQGNTMYILTGRATPSGWPRIHIPGYSAGTYKKSHTPEAVAFIFTSQQHPSRFARWAVTMEMGFQMMKFLACSMSVKDVKNESPWNLW